MPFLIPVILAVVLVVGVKVGIASHIRNVMMSSIVETILFAVFWIIMISIIMLIGFIFNMSEWVSWMIDFIFIIYLFQAILSIITGWVQVSSQLDSWGWILSLFGVSILQIAISLGGLGIIYAFVAFVRYELVAYNGGGFLNWVYENFNSIFSYWFG